MANKTILICGYGPGISAAIAHEFGRKGFQVALVARNAEKLAESVRTLEAAGIRAVAFPADLSNPAEVPALIANVRAKLGPVTVLQWNAYGSGAGDLLTASADELAGVFDIPIVSFITAVQAALPDLRADAASAVLVTNGGLGLYDEQIDRMAVEWNAMGLAVANAAKHKAVGVLAAKLERERVYVGEVVVMGLVKGTPWATESSTLEASAVAAKFWELYSARSPVSAQIS